MCVCVCTLPPQRHASVSQAAKAGHEAVVVQLLGWAVHAPRADSQEGLALVVAARYGHDAIVQRLLRWEGRVQVIEAPFTEGMSTCFASHLAPIKGGVSEGRR